MSRSEVALRRHRALADPSRSRIYAEIVDHGPLEVLELAPRMNLHPNSVRAHLTALQDAGLVVSERAVSARPGRPPLRYRSTGAEQTEMRRYQLLAEILTGFVAGSGPAEAERLEQVGEAWGHHLVDSPPPFATLDTVEGVERVVALLDESGFSPVLETDEGCARITMSSCPFLELARRHPDVVCPIHLGILRGALAELGSDLTATRLEPFRTPDTCVAHLGPRRHDAGNGTGEAG